MKTCSGGGSSEARQPGCGWLPPRLSRSWRRWTGSSSACSWRRTRASTCSGSPTTSPWVSSAPPPPPAPSLAPPRPQPPQAGSHCPLPSSLTTGRPPCPGPVSRAWPTTWLPTNLPTNTGAHSLPPTHPHAGKPGGQPGRLGEAQGPHSLTILLCPQTRRGLLDLAPSSKRSLKAAAGPGPYPPPSSFPQHPPPPAF